MSTRQDGTTEEKDPEIAGAYDRLGRSLDGPVDVLVRVEHRMRARRRQRAALAGGASALALVVAGTTAALTLGGDDQPSTLHVTDEPAGPVSTLAFTRADGSTYTFRDIEVTCKKDPDSARQLVTATSPRKVRGDTLLEPFLMFQASLDEVEGGRTFTLPVDDVATSKLPMILFFATDEGGPRANELSSTEPSTGTVQVLQASCGPTPSLDLRVDARLGSEVEQSSMRLTGELHAP